MKIMISSQLGLIIFILNLRVIPSLKKRDQIEKLI